MIVAVDFDGTLCNGLWPYTDDMNLVGIYVLKEFKSKGGRVILWTCRTGQALQDAIDACASYGLHFDAVNENDPQHIEHWEAIHGKSEYSAKVYADLYIDDRAMMTYEGVPWARIHSFINGSDIAEPAFYNWLNMFKKELGGEKGIIKKMRTFLGTKIDKPAQYCLYNAPRRTFLLFCEDLIARNIIGEKEKI